MESQADQISYSVVRIETDVGTGTGFLYNFGGVQGLNETITLVTNKHVIANSKCGKLQFCSSPNKVEPCDTVHQDLIFENSFCQHWIPHPDAEVDLTFMYLGSYLAIWANEKRWIYCKCIANNIIINDDRAKTLSVAEDVIMVGYPNGLADDFNNKPIFRSGITSTKYVNNYNGKQDFLVDIACFPGSSGSPVFLKELGMREGRIAGFYTFLGIVYKNWSYSENGVLEKVEIPSGYEIISKTFIPLNLAIVMKATRLLELDEVMRSRYKGNDSTE